MGNKEIKQPHFRTNVLLKSIIGNELINNDDIAVLELVKNSFDAASKKVEVSFVNLKDNDDAKNKTYSSSSSKIIIQDWGIGMNKRDVLDNWLNIAFSEKIEKKKEFGRILAGAKGIGRFSCDRLGKYLDIYSRKEGDKSYVHLKVDWTKFEGPANKNLEIQKIPVAVTLIRQSKFKETTNFNEFSNGTIVEISKLKAKWAYQESHIEKGKEKERWVTKPLIDLRKYLEKLINPNQVFGDKNTFNIFLSAKEFIEEDKINNRLEKITEIINGKIENKIFEKLDFHTTSIESYVSNDNKQVITKLNDKGRNIYRLVEDISKNTAFKFLKEARVYVFFLNTYAKVYFAKQTGVRLVNFGSIFLFKNGFRIPPYGEEHNDWLGLERRKGQGQRRFLGTRDIVGRIEIYDSGNTFREVTSREGLVENEAFSNLKNGLFLTAFKRLEKYVVEGLNWDSIPQEMKRAVQTNKFESEIFALSREEKDRNAIDAISSLIKTHGDEIIELEVNTEVVESLAAQEKEKFDRIYSEFEKYGIKKIDKNAVETLMQIKELLDKKELEIKLLKEKAISVESETLFSKNEVDSDPREVVALQHHINQGTERINRNIAAIKNIIVNEKNDALIQSLDRISFETKKISTLAKFVTKAKFNVVTVSSEQDIVAFITEYIEHVYKNYADKIVNKELVDVVIFMKEKFDFIFSFRPLDIIIIIDNLLDNAFKAKASLVSIYIEKINNSTMELRIKDNGNGLDKSITDKERIFDFGFTTTDGGSGIGLYHVKSIIEKMRGGIEINVNAKSEMEFVIKFKRKLS